jgi:hypothetical protein
MFVTTVMRASARAVLCNCKWGPPAARSRPLAIHAGYGDGDGGGLGDDSSVGPQSAAGPSKQVPQHAAVHPPAEHDSDNELGESEEAGTVPFDLPAGVPGVLWGRVATLSCGAPLTLRLPYV